MKHKLIWVSVLALGFLFSAALKAEEGSKEYKGSAGCAMCAFSKETKAEKCAAAFKVGDTVYMLKASEKADDATKAALKKVIGMKAAADMTVTGTVKEEDGKKVLLVDAVKPETPK